MANQVPATVSNEARIQVFARSIFDYLGTLNSIAGLEPVFLATFDALGRQGDSLFGDGTGIWNRICKTGGFSAILVLDRDRTNNFVALRRRNNSIVPNN